MRRILATMLLLALPLAIAGCGQYGQRYDGSDDSDSGAVEERRITDERFDEEVRKRDGCTEVEEFESEGSSHVDDPDVKYEHNPPHSGDHSPVPVDWGLYGETQTDVATVHNLEHGHLVISHKGLSDEQEEELLDQARTNSFHLVVHPREKNPKKGVYYTAWTAQLYCERPSAAALQHMIDNWRDQGPELFTDDPGGVDEMRPKQRDES